MSQIYFAAKSMGILVILILLYANHFELIQYSRKKFIFSQLLVLNGIVVMADAISWLPLDWQKSSTLLGFLLSITYVLPFFIVGNFSEYIYEHISSKEQINKKSFKIIMIVSISLAILCWIFCMTGKMFEIREGKYYTGDFEIYYYIFYIIILSFFLE